MTDSFVTWMVALERLIDADYQVAIGRYRCDVWAPGDPEHEGSRHIVHMGTDYRETLPRMARRIVEAK